MKVVNAVQNVNDYARAQATADSGSGAGYPAGEQSYQALLRSSSGATAEALPSALQDVFAAAPAWQARSRVDEGAQQAGDSLKSMSTLGHMRFVEQKAALNEDYSTDSLCVYMHF